MARLERLFASSGQRRGSAFLGVHGHFGGRKSGCGVSLPWRIPWNIQRLQCLHCSAEKELSPASEAFGITYCFMDRADVDTSSAVSIIYPKGETMAFIIASRKASQMSGRLYQVLCQFLVAMAVQSGLVNREGDVAGDRKVPERQR